MMRQIRAAFFTIVARLKANTGVDSGNRFMRSFILILAALAAPVAANASSPEASVPGRGGYVEFRVDRIEVDTAGLTGAAAQLAGSIDRLAVSIDGLAQSEHALSEAEKADLVRAVQSVERASNALADLAEQLPLTARNLTDRLPQVVENARGPIAELSSGLKTASDGVLAITESLPQATANARQLVDETVDSVLIRVSTYTLILIALLALALIAVAWFIYARYLAPIARLFAPLAEAPEQLSQMAAHMASASQTLAELKQAEQARPYRRYRRRPPSSSITRPV